jgi:hypothetical protein
MQPEPAFKEPSNRFRQSMHERQPYSYSVPTPSSYGSKSPEPDRAGRLLEQAEASTVVNALVNFSTINFVCTVDKING